MVQATAILAMTLTNHTFINDQLGLGDLLYLMSCSRSLGLYVCTFDKNSCRTGSTSGLVKFLKNCIQSSGFRPENILITNLVKGMACLQ